MKDFSIKNRFIYKRYLVIASVMIMGYTLLRYLLDIRLNILPLKEDVLELFLPAGFTILLIILFLGRRLSILSADPMVYGGVAAFAIIVPTVIAQQYIKVAFNTLIEVEDVSQIVDVKPTDCFIIRNLHVDMSDSGIYMDARVSGKNSETLTFYHFTAFSLQPSVSLTGSFYPLCWLGIVQQEFTSNRISNTSKDELWKDFYYKSMAEVSGWNTDGIEYYRVAPLSDTRDGYIKAIESQQRYLDTNKIIILEPIYESFSGRKGNKLMWVGLTFIAGSLIFFLILLKPYVNMPRYRELVSDCRENKKNRLPEFFKFFIPRKPHFTTSLLMDINMLIFIVMVIAGINPFWPTATELFEWGGVRLSAIKNGEYYRLISFMFVHAGIMHLALNMFCLGISGYLIEGVMGKWKILFIYLLSGILGGINGLYFNPDPVTAGASGAISGLMGTMLALCFTRTITPGEKGVFVSFITITGGISLLTGLFFNGINNAAHLGGFAAGFILSFLFILPDRKKKRD